MSDWQPGQKVLAGYKSGQYIGEIFSVSPPKAKVRVLAVFRHPSQGDLHHPGQPDVAMFHQRKALAYREIAVVSAASLRNYEDEVPDYEASLRKAFDTELERIRTMDLDPEWVNRAEALMEDLKKDYGW